MGCMDYITKYLVDEEDTAFEYELQRSPDSLLTWERYLERWKNRKKSSLQIAWLYERFCEQFPTQERPWCSYLKWVLCEHHFDCVSTYQRFIKVLENFPPGCEDLCMLLMEFSISEYQLGMIRHVLDVSLRKLSRGSHYKIWEKVLRFLKEKMFPLTKMSNSKEEYQDEDELTGSLIYQGLFGVGGEKDVSDYWSSLILQRYLKVVPNWKLEDCLSCLAFTKDHQAVRDLYQQYLNGGKELEATTSIPFQIQLNYLEALDKLQLDVDYESFLWQLQIAFPERSTDFTIMWAKHEIVRSRFRNAIEILENSMNSTLELASFVVVFEFTSLFERLYLQNVIEELKSNPELQKDAEKKFHLSGHLSHLKSLLESYQVRLVDLRLRQNPNSVEMWQNRAKLFPNVKDKCKVYAEAILTIEPLQVLKPGSLGTLWCEYAMLYWNAKDFETAREIWNTALKVPYSHITDLENILINWAEQELAMNGIEKPLHILNIVLKVPDFPEKALENYKRNKNKVPVQAILFTSLALWSFYLDLQEAYSTKENDQTQKIISTYEKMIYLKVATPMHFIQYANFLRDYAEDNMLVFQIYERALSTFPEEIQYEIWNVYLEEATSGDSVLPKESIRDLFDNALESLIANQIDCGKIFLLYSDFEEKNGLCKRSVDILLRGCHYSNKDPNLWEKCVSKAQRLLGGEGARRYYSECLQNIPICNVIPQVLAFAELETQLGELARAREILKFGAALFHPSKNLDLWEFWDEFELQNGNKESYKSMLKLKRKLESEFTVNGELGNKKERNVQFVPASQKNTLINPEEIDLNI